MWNRTSHFYANSTSNFYAKLETVVVQKKGALSDLVALLWPAHINAWQPHQCVPLLALSKQQQPPAETAILCTLTSDYRKTPNVSKQHPLLELHLAAT